MFGGQFMKTLHTQNVTDARKWASSQGSEGDDILWRSAKDGKILGASFGRVFRSTRQEPVATDKSKAMRLVASIRGQK